MYVHAYIHVHWSEICLFHVQYIPVLFVYPQHKAKVETTALEMTYGSVPGSPSKRKVPTTTPANAPAKVRKVRSLYVYVYIPCVCVMLDECIVRMYVQCL